jgi:hypothetical protein
MPRYRANVRFGPWRRGDEFESEDALHANMAVEGKLLTEVDQRDAEATGPASQWSPPADEASSDEPTFDWGDDRG